MNKFKNSLLNKNHLNEPAILNKNQFQKQKNISEKNKTY